MENMICLHTGNDSWTDAAAWRQGSGSGMSGPR